ncbi:hypothetical protein Scep_027342 [Stephania cephalantha]|uniref:Uncharacterized protein n=1 Tax=Stephania cephalantha TaxID=152367 RepID=A0AAP0HMG8_9MAGN
MVDRRGNAAPAAHAGGRGSASGGRSAAVMRRPREAKVADGGELQRPAATRAGELTEAATARRRRRGCWTAARRERGAAAARTSGGRRRNRQRPAAEQAAAVSEDGGAGEWWRWRDGDDGSDAVTTSARQRRRLGSCNGAEAHYRPVGCANRRMSTTRLRDIGCYSQVSGAHIEMRASACLSDAFGLGVETFAIRVVLMAHQSVTRVSLRMVDKRGNANGAGSSESRIADGNDAAAASVSRRGVRKRRSGGRRRAPATARRSAARSSAEGGDAKAAAKQQRARFGGGRNARARAAAAHVAVARKRWVASDSVNAAASDQRR